MNFKLNCLMDHVHLLWSTSFSVAGPRIWTDYPPHCSSLALNLDTLNNFKGISVWRDHGALVTLWFQCAVYISIYLLTYLFTIAGRKHKLLLST